jgi:hypothetical protein
LRQLESAARRLYLKDIRAIAMPVLEGTMSSFWSAMAVAIVLAFGANVVLGALQQPAEIAFTTSGVRL